MVTIIEETEQTKAQETTQESIVPPPGFLPFQWPQAEWEYKGDAMLAPELDFVASWSARIMEDRSSTPPHIPLSSITAEVSQDSIVVQVGSPTTEKYRPTGPDQIRSVHRPRPRRPMKGVTECKKPAPAEDFLLAGREFRKIGHLVTSFYNFAWCYIYVYCFQKTPQTKWGSPLVACMHTIQNGHHP